MPFPIGAAILGGSSIVGGLMNWLGGNDANDTQQQINQSAIEYQMWLQEQQAQQEAMKLNAQKEMLMYVGLAVLFIIVLLVIVFAI